MNIVTAYIVARHDADGFVKESLTVCFKCAVKEVIKGEMDMIKPKNDFSCDVYECRTCDLCHNFI